MSVARRALWSPSVLADVPALRIDARGRTLKAASPTQDLLAVVESPLPPVTQTLVGAFLDVGEPEPGTETTQLRRGATVHGAMVDREQG